MPPELNGSFAFFFFLFLCVTKTSLGVDLDSVDILTGEISLLQDGFRQF